jgi:GNAT superfamily N-acetyltransferase
VDIADPAAAVLLGELREYYVQIYGGDDATPYELDEFRPPRGNFLLARVAGRPVATGGWRWHEGGTVAEVKRMYVVPALRRRGLARRMLTALERDAAAAGAREMVLMTGTPQPEALGMYTAAGYRPVTPFGTYAGWPDARHLGKRL